MCTASGQGVESRSLREVRRSGSVLTRPVRVRESRLEKRTIYMLRNRTVLFAPNTVIFNDNRWHKKVCRCEDFPNGRGKLVRLGGAARAPSRPMTGDSGARRSRLVQTSQAQWCHTANTSVNSNFQRQQVAQKGLQVRRFPKRAEEVSEAWRGRQSPSRRMTGSTAPTEADWFKPHKRNGAILPTQASTVIFNDSKWHKRFAGGVSRWRQCDL